jgi:nitrate reductase alpha subunit
MFVWRSNLLGSSGKGHEYFCKHLLGTENGVQGKDLGKDDAKPAEVKWHPNAPQGKLDLERSSFTATPATKSATRCGAD